LGVRPEMLVGHHSAKVKTEERAGEDASEGYTRYRYRAQGSLQGVEECSPQLSTVLQNYMLMSGTLRPKRGRQLGRGLNPRVEQRGRLRRRRSPASSGGDPRVGWFMSAGTESEAH